MSDEKVPLIAGDNKILTDHRLFSTNTCDFAGEAYVPASQEEFFRRREDIRRRLLLSAGLLPEIDLPEVETFVSEGKFYHGVLIKEVRVESLPGLQLTGSLFLPLNFTGKLPGILCPHGHWANGRVHHAPDGGVVMRCFELAKLGFVVFAYDMVGYNDCNGLPHAWDSDLVRVGNLSGVSTFGLQTVNSMRAVDFLVSRPEVDPERIACTGASGGGSQTWFISALDERIKVIAPVCMLSSHFQGGCPCEEGPALRVNGLTSFDILAACAPRPVMIPCVTGDWTNFNPYYEVPQMKKVYALFGAEDKVESFYYEDKHNYNRRTREHVYAFLVRQLQGIDRGEIIPESDDEPPPPELLWHGGRKPAEPSPAGTLKNFSMLTDFMTKNVLDTRGDFAGWREKHLTLLKELLATPRDFSRGAMERVSAEWVIPGGKARGRVVSNRGAGNRVVTVDIVPDEIKEEQVVILAAHGEYTGYFADGENVPLISSFMERGCRVRLVELTGSGSLAKMFKYAVRNPENFAPAFDESLFSMRVQDLLSAVELLRTMGHEKLRIYAESTAVPVALAAAALSGIPIDADMAQITDAVWLDKLNYQVLIRRLGGIGGLLMLNAGKDNQIRNTDARFRDLLSVK